MDNHIYFFDTTLRDGEQSPGNTMNLKEKLLLAKQLEKLGVDVIEAGFPAASPGDFEAVEAIAGVIENAVVAGLSRALESDIQRTFDAIKDAKHPRIHTFIATSPLHMEYKLKMTPEEVYQKAVDTVKFAKSLTGDVEFSAEDASRSELPFLAKVIEGVIEAGATVVNIPDTVGYTTPEEYAHIITYLKENVKNIDSVIISVHCHNDLGLAVSNSISAFKAGARQVECTINGIGERAGNAALEEIVMALETRKDFYGFETGINTREIAKTSQLLTSITGVPVQPNKAIVGSNAFAHESGIHQHGVLAHKSTYEIMSPESIGVKSNKLVLGKHSGRHSFVKRLEELGYTLEPDKLKDAFEKFKDLADKKKNIYDRDLIAIAMEESVRIPQIYQLKSFTINTGTGLTSTATVTLESKGDTIEEVAIGDGPVDAAYNAIKKIVGIEGVLKEYKLDALTEGMDAQGEAMVTVIFEDRKYKGHGLSTDVLESSILAYIEAMNRILDRSKEN
ncbi:MAG: 2-isopropylmalate synthase [delta proteobacterium ML8_F1]|nr:MAG: 2-isopropylmalate synthase [delta proteobacterium ML8_F1]